MGTYEIGKNMQRLIDELSSNQDFNYLFNYHYNYLNYRNSGFGKLSSHWYNADDFIYNFCNHMPYFPASLFHDEMTTLPKELSESKNYIICTLFIAACIDSFLEKYMSNVIPCQDNFSNFAIVDYNNNEIDTEYIKFEMLERHIPYRVEIKVRMPDFTINKYEDFNTIQDFLSSSGNFIIDIKRATRKSIDRHVMFRASVWGGFTQFLASGLAGFKKDNNI